MKLLKVILVLAAAALLFAQAESALERAIRKETLEGDLRGAIDQYKKLAQGKDRAVAAKSLVRMGQCYEKLGDAEAHKAYERAVRDFSDQTEAVATARARLAVLGSGGGASGGMSLRRVDSGERFRLIKGVSADGRFIGFSYYESGGSQGLYDTVTKQEKILVKLDWNGTDYGGSPALSKDGKWLAFATYKYGGTEAELRVVRADGSSARTVYRLTGKSWIIPKDWSPDNRQVLAQISHQGTTYLELVNVADGSVKRLKQVSSADRHAFVSPDGAFIVYVALGPRLNGPPTPQQARDLGDVEQQGEVRIMAIDGAGDQALLSGGPSARPMGWTPDGKGILLISRKSGEPGLWFVPVTNGKASGEPRLLRAAMSADAWPAGLTADGRFYFVETVGNSNSYLLQLDAGSGAPGKPVRVTPQFEDGNGYTAWSPDGRKLAWFGMNYSGTLLHVRELGTGREKTLAFPAAPGPISPQWLADNRTIVYSRPAGDLQSVHAFDTETSESRLLAENVTNFHTITSDGGTIYQVRAPDYDKITALDTRTKSERQVAGVEGRIFHLAVSPDGKSVAVVILPKTHSNPRRLAVIDTQTGRSRDLVEPQSRGVGFFRRSIGWTPDGSRVVVRASDGVWAYPATGGEGKLLFRTGGTISDVAVSPDGRTLSYTQGAAQHDLWVLENFLPRAAK